MLLRQIERIERSRKVDLLIVATSTDPSDDLIAAACQEAGVACFRGSLTDVLDRFVQAARPHRPTVVVRLTGDSPLADPGVIDQVIDFFEAGDYDYASNCMPPTFPDGLDVEVMLFKHLEQAAREAVLPSHREHVTPFLRAHQERYRLGNIAGPADLSHLRWTVDEPEDLEFVRLVYERLYPAKPDFTMRDILDLVEREPAMQSLNSRFTRNEGSKTSLQADAEYLARNR
jgi:spore coat polysaccharide biosynthesis protein SpsF (cytidylyltransferase family)